VVIDHNTVDQGYNFATLYKGAVWTAGTSSPLAARFAIESLTVTNTLGNHNEYGVFGEDAGLGTPALTALTRSYTWTHNVLAGGAGQPYPPVTWQPTMAEHRAQFGPDYSLVVNSTYRNAGNDGQDLGAVRSGSTLLEAPRNPRIQR
jgi:hypothetical protein